MKIRFRFTLLLSLSAVLFFGLILNVQAGEWLSLQRTGPGGAVSKALKHEIRAPETRIKEASLKSIRKTISIDYEIFNLLHNRTKLVGNAYDLLEVGDCAPATVVGQPALPVKTIFIEIPLDHDFTVTVNEGEKVVLNNYYLMPNQAPPPDQSQLPQIPDPEFVINEDLYQQDRMYPSNRLLAARRIRLRDHELLEIRFTPLRFNPRAQTIEATTQTTLDIELYPQSSRSAKGFTSPTSLASTGFDQSFQGGIFSAIPKTRDLTVDAAKTEPEIYMLIFADQFTASPKLKEFCTWKRQKGYRVVEVPTSKIPAAQRGAPTHKELVSYLRAQIGRAHV